MNSNKCKVCDSKAPIAKCIVCNGTKEYTNFAGEIFTCSNCYGLGFIKLAFCVRCWRILKIAENFPRNKKINNQFWRSKFYGGKLKPEHFPQKGDIIIRKCNAMEESDEWSISRRAISEFFSIHELCKVANKGTTTNFLEFKLKE